MIPRTKVNYAFADLMRAVWVREQPQYHNRLTTQIKRHLGAGEVILTPSGRGSLYFILQSLPQIRTVVVPAYTCKAVVEAIALADKSVVYAATSLNTFNMEADDLPDTLDRSTAILATHQYGIPCGMQAINRRAKETGALVIEDVAAALGTEIDGQPAGIWGDVSFFSFDSTKLINVPMKGGFIYTRNKTLARSIRQNCEAHTEPMPLSLKLKNLLKGAVFLALENHRLYALFHRLYFSGQNRFTNDQPGLNPNLTEFYRYRFMAWQASIASEQFARLPAIIQQRRTYYRFLHDTLQQYGVPNLPPADEHSQWACIRFPLRISEGKLPFYERAYHAGLDVAFSFTYIATPADTFPEAHQLAHEVVNLPFYTKLTRHEAAETCRITASVLTNSNQSDEPEKHRNHDPQPC